MKNERDSVQQIREQLRAQVRRQPNERAASGTSETPQEKLDEVTQALLAAGFSTYESTDDPAGTIDRLVNERFDTDWRDAFMACLTAGLPVDTAKMRATSAAETMRKRRSIPR